MDDKKIFLIERPAKLGLGSAHKLGLIYSIKKNYDFVLSMDADFSHHPKYIPSLISLSEKGNFVIGSRFCKGGSSEYRGLRKYISILGNKFTSFMLNFKLKESYYCKGFRVCTMTHVKKNSFQFTKSRRLQYGVKLIWYLKITILNWLKTPIHFHDRKKGKSKLPENANIY